MIDELGDRMKQYEAMETGRRTMIAEITNWLRLDILSHTGPRR